MKRLLAFMVFCLPFLLLCPNTQAQWENAQVQRLTFNQSKNLLYGLHINNDDRLTLFYYQAHWDPDFQPYKDTLFVITRSKAEEWSGPEKIGYPPFDLWSYSKNVGYDPSRGTTHIVYESYPFFGCPETLYYTNSDIPGWEPVRIDSLREEQNPEYSAVGMAFDSLANVHIAWHVDYDSAYYNWYRLMYSNNAAGEWSTQQVAGPVFLGSIEGSAEEIPLAVEKSGVVHLMYQSPGWIYHAENDTLGGQSWVVDSLPFPSWWNSGGPTSLAVDGEGNLHMCLWGGPWPWDPFSYILYYYRAKGSPTWGEPDTLTNNGIYDHLFVDAEGRPHLTWQRTSGTMVTNDIVYASKDGGSWSSYQILDEDPWNATGMLFVIGSEGKGIGAFANATHPSDSSEVFLFGAPSSSVDDRDSDNSRVANFTLSQNYPNPFNSSTVIGYYIPKEVTVNLTIYNVAGQKVGQLVNRVQRVGRHQISWDATNERGESLASGIYLYTLIAGHYRQTKKLLFIK